MFERFTRDARQAVTVAQHAARELGHGRLGTEHLLLGIAADDGAAGATLAAAGATPERLRAVLADTAPAEALGAIGIDLAEVRRRAEASFGPGALERARGRGGNGSPRLTPEAKKALELALREAIALGDDFIGTEHVLLGVLRGADRAALGPLERAGADPAALRAALLQARDRWRRSRRRRRGA
jgi:ATP-dependent Clp protease ATP-binding subunit ClpA